MGFGWARKWPSALRRKSVIHWGSPCIFEIARDELRRESAPGLKDRCFIVVKAELVLGHDGFEGDHHYSLFLDWLCSRHSGAWCCHDGEERRVHPYRSRSCCPASGLLRVARIESLRPVEEATRKAGGTV